MIISPLPAPVLGPSQTRLYSPSVARDKPIKHKQFFRIRSAKSPCGNKSQALSGPIAPVPSLYHRYTYRSNGSALAERDSDDMDNGLDLSYNICRSLLFIISIGRLFELREARKAERWGYMNVRVLRDTTFAASIGFRAPVKVVMS